MIRQSEISQREWQFRCTSSYMSHFAKCEALNSDDQTWLIALSDLMSLLLIFFLVWTVINLGTKNNGNQEQVLYEQATTHITSKELENLKTTALEMAPATLQDDTLVIVLQEGVSFDSGEAYLLPQAKMLLERISPVLKKEAAFYQINIIGHTDDLPLKSTKWSSNMELSIARATSVWKELVRLGLPPENLKIQGLGSKYPAVENKDESHRRTNRRVEIVLQPVSRPNPNYS